MKSVRQILNNKGRTVWSISPNASVYSCIELMSEKGVGALAVTDNDRLVGIISERDYARKVILKGKASKQTPISEVMTTDVVTAAESMSVEDAMALMTERHIRHLPIVESGKLTGMISIGDLVKARLQDQQHMIEHLESYITQ